MAHDAGKVVLALGLPRTHQFESARQSKSGAQCNIPIFNKLY